MEKRPKMHLAMMWFAPGSHGAGWRMPGAARSTVTNFDTYVEVAKKCEDAKLDALFFADGNAIQPTPLIEKRNKAAEKFYRAAIIEAMSVIPALAAVTSKLGLIATGTTTYNEPFTIARRFATIDLISKGRAGWNLVTSQHENEAQNFGFEKHMEHDERYVRAEEFFDVVTGLWNSWDEDALVQDKENARYFDVEKVHVLNHKGKYFNVKGPLNVPRSPQGRPVIVQAGSSGPGRNLAARIADLVFSANSTIEESKAFTDDLKARSVSYGRPHGAIKLMPGFMPIIGRTKSEAKEHLSRASISDHRRASADRHQPLRRRPRPVQVSARRAATGTAGCQRRTDAPADHDRDGAARKPEHPPDRSAFCRNRSATTSSGARLRKSPTSWRIGTARAPATASASCRPIFRAA